jgi:hypothetical protein
MLPQGTEIIVLQKPAEVTLDGIYQPEFFARTAYPLRRDLLLRRDALNGAHRTRTTYPRSQDAGVVYFLYALAPDSTLYWSFSPPKDSLKFDVVNQGVMSVAPVLDAAAGREIIEAFFRGIGEEPVAVIMRNRAARADSAVAAPPAGGMHDAATLEISVAGANSEAAALDAGSAEIAASGTSGTDADGEVAATSETPGADGVAAASETTGTDDDLAGSPLTAMATGSAAAPGFAGGMGFGIFIALFGAMLLLAAVSVYYMRRYHAELTATRTEIFSLRMQQLAASPHPDRIGDLQRAIEESERKRERSERAYELLQARYQELLHELDRGDVQS